MTTQEWIEHLRIGAKSQLFEITPRQAGDLANLLTALYEAVLREYMPPEPVSKGDLEQLEYAREEGRQQMIRDDLAEYAAIEYDIEPSDGW